MTIYDCKCCKFNTTLKSDYTRHLNTKKHIRNSSEQFGTKSEQNGTKTEQNGTKLCKKHKQYFCKYCEKGFTSEKSLKRHITYTCKQNDDEDLNELVKLLNLQLEQQEQQYKDQLQEQKKQNKYLQKQINQLFRKLQRIEKELLEGVDLDPL